MAAPNTIEGPENVYPVVISAEKSAKVLADKTIKGDKLSPEFDAQIDAIGGNTTVLLQNTLSLDALQTVLNDLPSKINDLRTKSDDQVKAFSLSSQMQTLQTDTTFKETNLQKATDAGAILRSIITQADITKADAKSIEDITSLGLTRLFPSMSSSNNPLSFFGAGSDMSGKQMEDFLKFKDQIQNDLFTNKGKSVTTNWFDREFSNYYIKNLL
jgi:hypothetical protein